MAIGSISSLLWPNAVQAGSRSGAAGGLRISGKTTEEAAALAAEKALRQNLEDKTASEAKSQAKAETSFGGRLAKLLETAKGGNSKHVFRLAAKLEETAAKIGEDFGEEAADRLRARLLEAAEENPTEQGLAGAAGDCARELAAARAILAT